MTLRQWDFFSRWVVVKYLFWLFLGRNHAFNLVQNLFIYVCLSSTLFLSTLVMLALVILLLSLFQHILSVHFAENGRDSGTRFAIASKSFDFHILFGATHIWVIYDSCSATLLIMRSWLLCLLWVQDWVDWQESTILRAHERSCARDIRQSGLRGLTCRGRHLFSRLGRVAWFLDASELGSEFFKLE